MVRLAGCCLDGMVGDRGMVSDSVCLVDASAWGGGILLENLARRFRSFFFAFEAFLFFPGGPKILFPGGPEIWVPAGTESCSPKSPRFRLEVPSQKQDFRTPEVYYERNYVLKIWNH